MSRETTLTAFATLHRARWQGEEAPHKPLMVLFALPLLYAALPRPSARGEGYLAGVGTGGGGAFRGAMGQIHPVDMRNYYLSSFFDEHALMRWGIRASAALAVAMVVIAWI